MSPAEAVFNILTFPGIVFNKAVQEYYIRKYEVPLQGPEVEEIAARLEDEKEKKGREEAFGENTEDTVRRMRDESGTYVDFYNIDEYEDSFVATLVPFFASSGAAFFSLLLAVLLFDSSVLYWLPPFWLGVALAAHSFPDAVATDALWQKPAEADSRLRPLGYFLAAVSKAANGVRFWSRFAYVSLLLLIALYFNLLLS